MPLAGLAGLLAALAAGCASVPARPPSAPQSIAMAVPAQLLQLRVDGPAAGADLAAALDGFRGRPADPETRTALAALLERYYRWYGFREVAVQLPELPDVDGSFRVQVTALPPAADAPPPAAQAPPSPEPEPAPAGARTLREEPALAAELAAWQASSSRVLVDAQARRLYLKPGDGSVVSFAVAVGQPSRRTPSGLYTVEAITPNPIWFPPASMRRSYEARGKPLPLQVPPGRKNPLGSWFVRLQKGIGIHGTNQPGSIGRAVSWGCIRMQEADVAELVRHLRTGDRVTVVRSPRELPQLLAGAT